MSSVPKYLESFLAPLSSEDWYGGCMNRLEAESLLTSTGLGVYLVRFSKNGDQLVLSASVGLSIIKHYIIYHNLYQKNFFMEDLPIFKSVKELIRYYKKTNTGLLPCLLTKGCKEAATQRRLREQVKTNHNAAQFREIVWEIDRNLLSVIKEIGRGNFGVVHLMNWTKPNTGTCKEVAVKALAGDTDATERAKFLEEVQFLTQLSSPHLVSLYGVCTATQPYLIVMEYMRNGSLSSYLRQKKQLIKLQELVFMAIQICDGMSYLSDRNYVHRDLRADNILVGEYNDIKIGDFGLARILHGDAYSVTNPRIPVKWTAPEALLQQLYTTKCDVWSFGVLLSEIISFGQKPYPDMSNHESVQMVGNGYRMPKESLGDMCHSWLYNIMLQCWNADPMRRPDFQSLKKNLSSELALAMRQMSHNESMLPFKSFH